MENCLDILIIYMLSIAFMLKGDMRIASVVAILVSLIFLAIQIFFDNAKLSTVLNIVYFMLCFSKWEFALMMAIMIYYNIYKKRLLINSFLVVNILMYTYLHFEIVVLYLVAMYFGYRAFTKQNKESEYFKLQESNMMLSKDLQNQKIRMIDQQDYEVKMATMSERNRIAREIHDNVGHLLSRSILQVGALKVICKDENLKESIVQLQDTLNTAMTSIRKSVHDLKDESIDVKLNIETIIKDYSNIRINLDCDVDENMPKSIKYCFITIIKEALTNVTKHSNADMVRIVLREHPGFYQLLVKDNGTNIKSIDKEGIGLENMRDRVEGLKGNIRFSIENGFEIFITIMKELKQ